MTNFNKAILIGHVTRDPEVFTTQNDKQIAKFGIAVNSKWGERDEVCFIECAAFGKRAAVIEEWIHKGDPILVEGRIVYSQWNDKQTGEKKSRHSIAVENFQFMPRSQGKAEQEAGVPPEDADNIPF